MRLLPCALAVLLIGCTSSLRRGDALADAGDWTGAYDVYAAAAQQRPGSSRAQQRLTAARGHALRLTEADLLARLQRFEFAAAGRLLSDTARYSPPPEWLAAQQARTRDALVARLRVVIAQDGARRAVAVLGAAHDTLPAAIDRAPLSAVVSAAVVDESRVLSAETNFAQALSLLDDAARRIPDPSAVLLARSETAGLWRTHLLQRADQDASTGKLGAAVVYAAGADALQPDGGARGPRLEALIAQSWGGLYLAVSGAPGQQKALRDALSAAWSGSPWRARPVRTRRPSTPHLEAVVRMTEARCVRAVVHAEKRQHSYRDGTFVPNPEVPALEAQLRQGQQELTHREARVAGARTHRADAAAQLRWASEEVARQSPVVSDAQRAARASEQRLRDARSELDASLQAQDQVAEREQEVQSLLQRRSVLERDHRAKAQSVATAEGAHDRAAAALAAAEAARDAAAAEHRVAAGEVKRLEAALASASQQLQSLPGERDRLRAAQREGRANVASLRSALSQTEADHEQATAAREALESRLAPAQREAEAAAQARAQASASLQRIQKAHTEVSARRMRTAAKVASLPEQIAAAATEEEAQRLAEMLENATQRLGNLTEKEAVLSGELAAAKEAVIETEAADEAARAALAALGDGRDVIRAEAAARRARAEAKQRLSAAEREQKERASRLEALETELAQAERVQAEARKALSGARAEEGRARQTLSSREAAVRPLQPRAKSAAAELREQRAALDEVSAAQGRAQARLTALEAELGALSASVSLLPARRSELSAARQENKRARARQADAERVLAPMLATQQEAERADADAAARLAERRDAFAAQQRRLEQFAAARAAAPAEVELVKQAPYTARTWTRRCTVSAQASVTGAAEGWSDTLSFTTSSQDETWAGLPGVGLRADPLVFPADDEVVLDKLRGKLQATVWEAVQAQMPREAAALRAQTGGALEATTQAQLIAHWMDPAPSLSAFVQSQYVLPAISW